MARIVTNNFLNGMVSPRMRRRADSNVYHSSARLMENLLPIKTGGFTLREGTVTEKENIDAVRIIPFIKSVTERYLLAYRNLQIDVYAYKDGAFKYISTEESPYTLEEIPEIQYTQDYERLVTVQGNHTPHIFKCHPDTQFPSGYDIHYIPIKLDTETNGSKADSKYIYDYKKDLGTDFNAEGEYPRCVAFCSNRLWFASSINKPYTIWGSQPFKPFNFQIEEYYSYVNEEATVQQYMDAVSGGSEQKGEVAEDGSFIMVRTELLFDENGKATGKLKRITEKHQVNKAGEYSSEILEDIEISTDEDGSYTAIETKPILDSNSKPTGKLEKTTKKYTPTETGYDSTVVKTETVDANPDGSYTAIETTPVLDENGKPTGKLKQVTKKYTPKVEGEYTVTIIEEKIVDYSQPITKWDKTVTERCALVLEVGSDRNEAIQWISASGDITIGTSSSEWIIPKGIDALQQQIYPLSSYGSVEHQRAIRCADGVFYIQSGGKKLRGLVGGSNGYQNIDLCYYCNTILEKGVKELHWRRVPEQRCYCLLNDGTIAVLSYDPAYGMNAWTINRYDGKVLSMCVMDTQDGQDVYILIERNGIKNLERFDETKYKDNDGKNTFIGVLETNGIDVTDTISYNKGVNTVYVDSSGCKFKAGQKGSRIENAVVTGNMTKVGTFTKHTNDELTIRIESIEGLPLEVLALITEVQ